MTSEDPGPGEPVATGPVLLVDDDPGVLLMLQRWLEPLRREIVACESFQAAREYLATHTPAVLVVDIRLKGHNGLQFVVWARDRRPETRCVVLTGFDDPVLRTEAVRLGARYLVKPITKSELLAAIQ